MFGTALRSDASLVARRLATLLSSRGPSHGGWRHFFNHPPWIREEQRSDGGTTVARSDGGASEQRSGGAAMERIGGHRSKGAADLRWSLTPTPSPVPPPFVKHSGGTAILPAISSFSPTLFPAFISYPYCSPLISALLVAQFSPLSPPYPQSSPLLPAFISSPYHSPRRSPLFVAFPAIQPWSLPISPRPFPSSLPFSPLLSFQHSPPLPHNTHASPNILNFLFPCPALYASPFSPHFLLPCTPYPPPPPPHLFNLPFPGTISNLNQARDVVLLPFPEAPMGHQVAGRAASNGGRRGIRWRVGATSSPPPLPSLSAPSSSPYRSPLRSPLHFALFSPLSPLSPLPPHFHLISLPLTLRSSLLFSQSNPLSPLPPPLSPLSSHSSAPLCSLLKSPCSPLVSHPPPPFPFPSSPLSSHILATPPQALSAHFSIFRSCRPTRSRPTSPYAHPFCSPTSARTCTNRPGRTSPSPNRRITSA
ncbi:unnamed protein product [Closterium sp. Naga37s-1]|nr:unnamed protein product [Closterium sp. Naga37s-1]